MTDSKTNISIEDKLAEKLKNDPLGTFFDESDLVPLARRAITEAFFKDTPETYNTRAKRAEAVVFAEKYMREKVKAWVDENFAKILDDEEIQKHLGTMMVSSLGTALKYSMEQAWNNQFFTNSAQYASTIGRIIKEKGY